VLLVAGTLIFNEIVIVKGLHHYTAKYLEMKDMEGKSGAGGAKGSFRGG
jgi:hypothetical protein